MIYHRFRLDISSEENMKKINPTTIGALENILKDEKFVILVSNIGAKWTPDSLLIGDCSRNHTLGHIKEIFSKLDLPYDYQESYINL